MGLAFDSETGIEILLYALLYFKFLIYRRNSCSDERPAAPALLHRPRGVLGLPGAARIHRRLPGLLQHGGEPGHGPVAEPGDWSLHDDGDRVAGAAHRLHGRCACQGGGRALQRLLRAGRVQPAGDR